MWKVPVLLFILPMVVHCTSDSNNVQMTRTSIKVARNLDPDAMETLEVKTRTGDVTTIMVKKRDGRQQQLAAAERSTPAPSFQLISSSNENAPRVPEPVVIRSDSVYVKNEKDEDKKSRSLFHVDTDGIPVITGVREPDDENDTQVWRNARVINGILVPNTEAKPQQQVPKDGYDQSKDEYKPAAVTAPMFNGVWQVYKKKPADTEKARPTVVAVDSNERPQFTGQRDSYDEKYMTDKILGYIKNINGNVLANGRGSRMLTEPRMEARVLHAPSMSVFPNSAAYSTKTAPRLSFEESARTPVLQYAHPELGVQAAAKYEPPVAEEVQRDGRRQQALSYFGHDIHADRSPFAFEPGLEKESRVKLPKKYSPHYSFPEKQGKYVPSYYVNDEASFWTLMKNKMKTSFDKMSDMTKPVVDPLVEATHKITGNLGFGSGNRELTNVVKEKLGMVATPSVLLPALGLVAGGAALGLGAVAVGRSVNIRYYSVNRNIVPI